MKQDWRTLPFEKSIVKVKYTTKIASTDYLKSGLYPIISQEEGLINGYWNNEKDVFKVYSPIIVFGDHTRILKYVDFDFVIGADGVKILQPINKINAKFLKYYIESCRIPSLGYSRHYKLLKKISVPIPPMIEQERIVAELDLLSDVIAKKREQLKQLDTLAQSIFYDMFGDPITNEKGWETSTIDNVCSSIIRGPFGSALKKEFFVEKGDSTYKVYEQKNAINKNALIGTYYISTEMYKSLSRFEIFPNDIIMSCSGTIGELFVIPFDAERGIINQALLKFTLNKKIEQNYFLFMMNLIKSKMDVKGCGIQNIGSVKYIKATMFGLPPLALQQQFASMIESIEKQKELIKQSLSEVQQLFDSRMDYYFG